MNHDTVGWRGAHLHASEADDVHDFDPAGVAFDERRRHARKAFAER